MSFSENPVLAERSISFQSIVESKDASVMSLAKENYEMIFKLFLAVLTDYFNFCHPVLIPSANRIAADLIETRPTWRAADVINLCKFFRQRQDIEELKVYGQITPEKFIANVSVYETHRAMALEQHHAKSKGETTNKHEKLNALAEKVAQKFKDKDVVLQDLGMGKQLEKTQAERERTGKDVSYRKEAPDQKFFNKINSGK